MCYAENTSVAMDRRYEMLALLCAHCIDEQVDGRWCWLDRVKVRWNNYLLSKYGIRKEEEVFSSGVYVYQQKMQ